jgi:hypothetical protein
MYNMIDLAEMKWAHHPHAIGRVTQCQAEYAEREKEHSKNKTEGFRGGQSSRKTKVKCDRSRNNMNYVMNRAQVRAYKGRGYKPAHTEE